jgi:hypothetical protein
MPGEGLRTEEGRNGSWRVTDSSGRTVVAVHETRAQAEASARSLARQAGYPVVAHRRERESRRHETP